MKVSESYTILREKNSRIPLHKVKVRVQVVMMQIKIHIIKHRGIRNVLIKTTVISMATSKQKKTFTSITLASIPVKISFGKMPKGNKKIGKRKKDNGTINEKIDNRVRMTIQRRSGTEATQKKKKHFIKRTWKVICLDGERTTTNTRRVHPTPMIRNTTILNRCSIEPSSTVRRYSQRRRRIMVSTHLKKILISINRIGELMQDPIFSVISICNGIIWLYIILLEFVIIKLSIKPKERTLHLNQLKSGLIPKRLKA